MAREAALEAAYAADAEVFGVAAAAAMHAPEEVASEVARLGAEDLVGRVTCPLVGLRTPGSLLEAGEHVLEAYREGGEAMDAVHARACFHRALSLGKAGRNVAEEDPGVASAAHMGLGVLDLMAGKVESALEHAEAADEWGGGGGKRWVVLLVRGVARCKLGMHFEGMVDLDAAMARIKAERPEVVGEEKEKEEDPYVAIRRREEMEGWRGGVEEVREAAMCCAWAAGEEYQALSYGWGEGGEDVCMEGGWDV